jgi:hypothetical protein
LLQLLRNKAEGIFVAAICLMAVSMPLSNFGMSVSIFAALGAFLLKPELKKRLQFAFMFPPAVSVFIIYLVFVAGLIHSDDFRYAFSDLRIKLPLLILPLLAYDIANLSREQIRSIWLCFVYATAVSCTISLIYYLSRYTDVVADSRKASFFISHIRLSLMIVTAASYLGAHMLNKTEGKRRWMFALLIVYFIAFLFIMSWFTGFMMMIVILAISSFAAFTKARNKLVKSMVIAFWSLAILLAAGEYWRLSPLMKISSIDMATLPATNMNNREYTHYNHYERFCENGHPFGYYYQWEELKQEWNKRSRIPVTDDDKKGQFIETTLARYLTSKGLPKDSLGVWSLTEEDIQHIESGVPNYRLPSLLPHEKRIYEFWIELVSRSTNLNSSGHSATMRFIFWRKAWQIIRQHLFFGVGTGDVDRMFKASYQLESHGLAEVYWLRAHNQYLTVAVATGFAGLLVFIVALFYVPIRYYRHLKVYSLISFGIVAASMITEDTIETQAGVTFTAYVLAMMWPYCRKSKS